MISDFLCICSEGVHVSWLVWSYTMGIMFSWAPPLSGPDCPFGDSQCGWVLMVDVSSSTQRLTFCLVLICDIRNNIDPPVKSKSKKSLLSSVLALAKFHTNCSWGQLWWITYKITKNRSEIMCFACPSFNWREIFPTHTLMVWILALGPIDGSVGLA